MKIIITESQRNNIIERLLKSSIPNIIDIKFKDIPVTVYGDGQSKNITKTVINIIVDPGNVFEGNLYNVKGESYSYMTLKQSIGDTLDKVLNINVSEYMSPYTYEVYIVNTKRV
jgi:dTDP-D-glucose 4,6-dehydratase